MNPLEPEAKTEQMIDEQQVLVAESEPQFKLIPAAVDFSTSKTQMTAGAALALVIALALGVPVGAGLIMMVAGAVLTGLIALEITGIYGNRLGGCAGLWSAILFAVSPWSREIGSVTSLITGEGNLALRVLYMPLYLLAVFAFLRHRRANDRLLFRLSLIFALGALLVNFQAAAVLPLIILLAEIFLPTRHGYQRWIAVALFFVLLSFVGSIVIVGSGFFLTPNIVPTELIQQWFPAANLRNFLAPNPAILIGYGIAMLSASFFADLRALLFAAGWMVIASANLSIAAAPLSILVSLAALPVTKPVPFKIARVTTIVGLAALTLIAVGWFLIKNAPAK